MSVSCCELLTLESPLKSELLQAEDVLTTRNHKVEEDVEMFGILFFSTNFTIYLEPKTEVHMRCSEVHGVGYVAEYLGAKGGDNLCHSHCGGDVTGRSLSVC